VIIVDLITHTDQVLSTWVHDLGPGLYGIVFLIVFCETGLVVTPFLPGDSLLFVLGSLTALENSELSLSILSLTFFAATILGDNTNYFLGKHFGPKVFSKKDSKIFNPKYLEKAHAFYLKYGVRAVIYARFVPIVRTFVPFVAGIGQMPYLKFLGFSFFGTVLWTQTFLWAGAIFGNTAIVRKYFQLVIFGVIFVSILPAIWSYFQAVRARKKAGVSS
jgi:membrane-associated protein